jgi:hypothetical protein
MAIKPMVIATDPLANCCLSGMFCFF